MTMGVASKPTNALTAMRHAATKLLTAYKVAQPPEENEVKAETLILEAIDLAKCAIDIMRRRPRRQYP